jgi:hypothetical protein
LSSIPSEEIVKWDPTGKDKLSFNMIYTPYLLTPEFKTKYFSELGMEIISHIERYGYSVNLIKEFFSQPLLNEKGEIRVVPTLDVIGITAANIKMVLFSRNAFRRTKRRISYYSRKFSSDPRWLNSWVKRHNAGIPNTEPLYWPELLIHELSHVVVIEEKLSDYVKRGEYEEKYKNEILNPTNTNLPKYLLSKMTTLDHGRDFRRVYRSLCKKYGVKPESRYAEVKEDE